MRDPIRERDLESAGAHSPVVDVDDKGNTTVTLGRDDLDRVIAAATRRTW